MERGDVSNALAMRRERSSEDKHLEQVLGGFQERGSTIKSLEGKVRAIAEKIRNVDITTKRTKETNSTIQMEIEGMEATKENLQAQILSLQLEVNAETEIKESLLLELRDGKRDIICLPKTLWRFY